MNPHSYVGQLFGARRSRAAHATAIHATVLEQFSPLRLFITLLVMIFCAEMGVMFSLDYLIPHGAPVWAGAVIDAGLVTAITSLFVWRLFMGPLRLALVSEAARATAVLDSTADGVVSIDERGTVEGFNRAAERMFAYRADEVIGRKVNMLMPEPHASEHDAHIARYIRSGRSRVIGQTLELPARRKDGAEFPVELSVTEIRLGGVRRFTAIIRDIAMRRQAEERIQHLAHHDALTDLPNRRLFYDRLGQAIKLARREGHELALLNFDLDRFKAVNDTLGHDAGDELLKGVAGRVRRLMRESDTVARVGGDEFGVILPRIARREDAAEVARKIISALAEPFRLNDKDERACIGSSVGIALYPADAWEIEALVRSADAAMYAAKRQGNSFRFSGAPDAQAAPES